jgi:antitoxin YqcF
VVGTLGYSFPCRVVKRRGRNTGSAAEGVRVANVLADNKLICRHAAKAFGGKPRVIAFWDDPHERSVDILICDDAPRPGLTSYSTVTLSDTPLIQLGKEFPARVEVAGACATDAEAFGNAISTVAFFVMKDKWFCRPGVVFETMLSMYDLSATMDHLYFTAPSQWTALNTTMELPTKKVTWLWAIPISEAESRFIAEQGDERFEDLLEGSGADVFDIHRPSIV